MLSSQVRAPAGVAGGRRRRSRTKIAVISIKGTKTRHTRKPRNQTAHSERRWLARHSTAEHSREEQIDLDHASQIEIERPNETREQTRNSTKGPGRKTRTDTAAGRPSDAKRFADTKSREFRKPEPAAAAAVHTHTRPHPHRPQPSSSSSSSSSPPPPMPCATLVLVPGEEDGREGSGRTQQVLEGT